MEAREAISRIRTLSDPIAPLGTGVSPTLRPLPGIRAVLFDVYGTLFVSASGEVGTVADRARDQAMEGALRACGLEVLPGGAARAGTLLPELIRSDHSRSRRAGAEHPEVEIRQVLRGLLETLLGEHLLANRAEPAAAVRLDRELCERLALEYECRINPTWPMPGVAQVLKELRDSGLVLGLVSNAQFYTPWLFPAHLAAEARELGVEEELCTWSYRFGEAKPSTSLFLPVLGRLSARGIRAESAVYVGNDLRNDIEPAARLGCRTILFAGDRRSYRPRTGEPGLAAVTPDAVITELVQLPGLLRPR